MAIGEQPPAVAGEEIEGTPPGSTLREGEAPGRFHGFGTAQPSLRGAGWPVSAGLLARPALLLALAIGWFIVGSPQPAGTHPLIALLLGTVWALVPWMAPAPQRSCRLHCLLPYLDVCWVLVAMCLTRDLQGALLPVLLVPVGVAALRTGSWRTLGAALMAAAGLVCLAALKLTGASLAAASAQAVALMAATLALRAIANREARERQRRPHGYLQHLETSSEAVLIVSVRTLCITYCNASASTLFGWASDVHSPLGLDLAEVIGLPDEEMQGARHRLLSGQGIEDVHETAATQRDGGSLRLMVTLSLLPAEMGDARLLVAVSQIAVAAPVERPGADRYAYDFTSHHIPALTHELNNHLGAIRLGAELAATTGALPDFEAMQEEIDHCQQVLQTVVTQLLRASAPPSLEGGMQPACDLTEAIDNAILLTRPQVLGRGVTLKLTVPEGPLPKVAVYPHELQEALARLVLRAADGLRTQTPPRLMSLQVTVHDDEVVVTVGSNGPGLSWKELAALNGTADVVPRGEHRVWTVIREGLSRYGGNLSASNSVTGGARMRITLKPSAPQEGERRYVHAS